MAGLQNYKEPSKLERWLDKLFYYKEIPDFWDPDQVYLKRWILIGKKRDAPGYRGRGLVVRLHKIMMSDSDRDLHDHPWSFLSFILKGAYAEEVWNEETQSKEFNFRMPFSFAWRPATTFHRLTLEEEDEPVWTIVVSFAKSRTWGFKTEDGWVKWDEYLAQQADIK